MKRPRFYVRWEDPSLPLVSHSYLAEVTRRESGGSICLYLTRVLKFSPMRQDSIVVERCGVKTVVPHEEDPWIPHPDFSLEKLVDAPQPQRQAHEQAYRCVTRNVVIFVERSFLDDDQNV